MKFIWIIIHRPHSHTSETRVNFKFSTNEKVLENALLYVQIFKSLCFLRLQMLNFVIFLTVCAAYLFTSILLLYNDDLTYEYNNCESVLVWNHENLY